MKNSTGALYSQGVTTNNAQEVKTYHLTAARPGGSVEDESITVIKR